MAIVGVIAIGCVIIYVSMGSTSEPMSQVEEKNPRRNPSATERDERRNFGIRGDFGPNLERNFDFTLVFLGSGCRKVKVSRRPTFGF